MCSLNLKSLWCTRLKVMKTTEKVLRELSNKSRRKSMVLNKPSLYQGTTSRTLRSWQQTKSYSRKISFSHKCQKIWRYLKRFLCSSCTKRRRARKLNSRLRKRWIRMRVMRIKINQYWTAQGCNVRFQIRV